MIDGIFNIPSRSALFLDASFLVHQYGTTVTKIRTRKYFLHNIVGNLVDRFPKFGCLVGGGVVDRYPDLTNCLDM